MGMQTMGHGGREAEKVRHENIMKAMKAKKARIEKEEKESPLEKTRIELRDYERALAATEWDLKNNPALKNSSMLINKAAAERKEVSRLKLLVENLEKTRDDKHE